jgi:transposase InsO family protein
MAVRDYLADHPGAVCPSAERTHYTDGFRRFIVGLVAMGHPGATLSVADLAFATNVPEGTLKDWLSPVPIPPAPPLGKESAPAKDGAESPTVLIHDAHLRLIVTLWTSWRGPFQGFCHMLRAEHQLPYGDTFVGNFLDAMGLRARRPHRPVEAPWSSDTFQSLLPGVQWLGDGKQVAIRWGEDTFVFNLEAILDVASNALLSLIVSDTEDEEAVCNAYQAALETAGAPPEALTLDNRPSNHSPGAIEGTPGTILLRSTPGRGQSKAPVEGAFGLFSQALPSLVVPTATPREQARCVLQLVLQAWGRGRNAKPRKKLDGRTPAEVYTGLCLTPQGIEAARLHIQELQRRQQHMQATRAARRDPVRIELLRQGLTDLHLADPKGRLAGALAGYSRQAIADGLAIFGAKKEQGTVPSDADAGRYLGGIIRKRHEQLELEQISRHLLERHLHLGDLTLEPLERAARHLRATKRPWELAEAFMDMALEADTVVGCRFWGQAAAEALSELPEDLQPAFYRSLCGRIAATYRMSRDRRLELMTQLAAIVARDG